MQESPDLIRALNLNGRKLSKSQKCMLSLWKSENSMLR